MKEYAMEWVFNYSDFVIPYEAISFKVIVQNMQVALWRI